nr:capsid protein [Sarcosphaera coronaria partitivirus]
MSSKFNVSARASALEKKVKPQTFQEVKLPENVLDFTSLFKGSSSAVTKTANVLTIDVFPNFIPIFMTILFHCVQLAPTIDARSHAKVTLPTFVSYCLTIVYGHILINDLYIRPSPSPYAQDYVNSDVKSRFTDALFSLPVPQFLEPILKKLTCTTLPSTPNVAVCPSASGFTLHKHFGRFFPVNIFYQIHDLTASINSRCTPKATNYAVFTQEVFSILGSSSSDKETYTIGNFLGAMYSHNVSSSGSITYSSSISRLRQAFESAFNPVLSRDYTRRSSLSSLNIVPQTFPSRYCNPYDLLFCYSPTNFPELHVINDTIAGILMSTTICGKTLGQINLAPSGISILQHGYSTMPLPTWHSVQLDDQHLSQDPDDITKAPKETLSEAENFATFLKFLPVPDYRDEEPEHSQALYTSNVKVPNTDASSDDKTMSANKLTVSFQHLSLLSPPSSSKAKEPAPSSFVKFSDEHDVTPTILVLTPGETDEESAWTASCYGMIIESFELDGSVVPLPNAEGNSSFQNTQVLSSAIPYSSVYRATSFNGTTPLLALKRQQPKKGAHKAASLKFDFSMIRIPRVLSQTYDQFIPTSSPGIPGLSFLDNVVNISLISQFLGMNLLVPSRTSTKAEPPVHTKSNSVALWSPYSYTPVFPDFEYTKSTRHGHLASAPQCYFISNLRTIFGTDPQLTELQHFLLAMPIA